MLLEFALEPPKDPAVPQLFVPPIDIKVTVFAPGPTASDLTSRMAAGTAEVVGGICALALGRAVGSAVMIFPAGPQEMAAAQALRYNNSVLGLAHDGISLDVFDEFVALGGLDGLLRVRGALLLAPCSTSASESRCSVDAVGNFS